MKNLIILKGLIVFLFMCVLQFAQAQNYRGYDIEAFRRLEAKKVFVLGGDSVRNTTKLNSLDTILVTKEYLKGLQPYHGIYDRTQSTLSYNSGSRTITVTPASSYWKYYFEGIGYDVSTTINQTHASTTGMHFLYYNSSNTITVSASPWSILTDVLIATVYYNSSLGEGVLLDERHSYARNRYAHLEFHELVGAYKVSGFGISGYVAQPASPTDADNTFALTSGVIADEDIRHSLSELSDGGPYKVFYKTGTDGTWTWESNSVPYTWDTYIEYNEYTGSTWQLTDVPVNDYVNLWVGKIGAVNGSYQTAIIVDQDVHANLTEAQDQKLGDMNFTGFPIPEFVVIYKITMNTGAAYSTTGKCRIYEVVEENKSFGGSSGGATASSSHNGLTGIDGGEAGYYGHLTQVEKNRVVAFRDSVQANEGQKLNNTYVEGASHTTTLSNSGGSTKVTAGSGILISTLNPNTLNGEYSIINAGDLSVSNEIQDLSGNGAALSGYQIALSSDATSVTLPNESDPVFAADSARLLHWSDTIPTTKSIATAYDISLKAPSTGSTAYIWNGTTQQTGNYNINGTGRVRNFEISSNGNLIFYGYSNSFILEPNVDSLYFYSLSGDAMLKAKSLILTAPQGTSPLKINSTTLNTKFNADLLDGQHGSYYLDNANHSGDASGATVLTLATVNSNVGTYNNITINAKGLATAGSNVNYSTDIHSNITALNAVSGVNTGDQDLSGYKLKNDSVANSGYATQYDISQLAPASGSTAYIWNQNTQPQSSANAWVDGSIRAANYAVGTTAPYANSAISLSNDTAYSGAVHSYIITSNNVWTLGAGWSGTYATGFSYSGSGGGTLSCPITMGSKKFTSLEMDISGGSVTVTIGSKVITLNAGFDAGYASYNVYGSSFVVSATTAVTITNIRYSQYVSDSKVAIRYGDPLTGTNTGTINYEPLNFSFFVSPNTGLFTRKAKYEDVEYSVGILGLSKLLMGIENTAVGNKSVNDMYQGNYNTGLGSFALFDANYGNYNTAIGAYALYQLDGADTYVNSNTAIGFEAGLYERLGSYNELAQSSTYVGAQTQSYNGTSTNENVFGYAAIGLGTNSVSLGDANVNKLAVGNVEVFYQPLRTGYAGTLNQLMGSNGPTTAPSWKSLADLGIAPATGSGNYIWNGTSQQTANFNISGNGRTGGNFTVGNPDYGGRLVNLGGNININGDSEISWHWGNTAIVGGKDGKLRFGTWNGSGISGFVMDESQNSTFTGNVTSPQFNTTNTEIHSDYSLYKKSGVNKWELGNDGNNSFFIYDYGSNSYALTFAPTTKLALFSANVTAPTFQSTVATGTAPFTVASETLVSKLFANKSRSTGNGQFSISNLNTPTITEMGVLSFDSYDVNATNKPASGDNANGVITMLTHPAGETIGYGKQIAFINTEDLYMRQINGGSFNSWRKFWHDGNLTNPVTGTGIANQIAVFTGVGSAVEGKSVVNAIGNDYIKNGQTQQTANYNISGLAESGLVKTGAFEITDWNGTSSGYLTFIGSESSTPNAPTVDFNYGLRTKFHRAGDTYFTDLVFSLYNDDAWFRRHTDGGFASWRKIWHSGNLTNPVTSSSTSTNYLTKYTGVGNAITQSLIYEDGTNETLFKEISSAVRKLGLYNNTWSAAIQSNGGSIQILTGGASTSPKFTFDSDGNLTINALAGTYATLTKASTTGKLESIANGVGYLYNNNGTFSYVNSSFQTGTESYISNIVRSGNNLTFTGVGSAFNGVIGEIAITNYANTFGSEQLIEESSSNGYSLTVKNTSTFGQSALFETAASGTNPVITAQSGTADLFRVNADGSIKMQAIPTTTDTYMLTYNPISKYIGYKAASAVPDATYVTKGIASFNSDFFSLSSGHVSIATGGITSSYIGDKGSNTQILYNNNGTISGSANNTFDGTNVAVGGYVTSDETRSQTGTKSSDFSHSCNSGFNAEYTVSASNVDLTFTDLSEGAEGTIEIVISGSSITGFTIANTATKMGTKSEINYTNGAHTTIAWWYVNSKLYYGYIYNN